MKEIPKDKWIPEDTYKKFLFQMTAQMNDALQVFNIHGLGVYIPGATEACAISAELFCENVRGRDIPLTPEMVRYRRNKRR